MADSVDDIAGEYVLGTLDAAERRAFDRQLLTNPSAVAAVAAWQERLSPLLLTLPETAPPPALWTRIGASTAPANDNSRLRRWQMATAAAALVALVSTGVALRPPPTATPAAAPQLAQAPARPAQFRSVAALTQEGGTPALLVTYDPDSKEVLVTPVNVASYPGQSLELWAIGGEGVPKSIGLMRDKGATALERLAVDLRKDMTIAVSVEPRGGSPTGLPTGPVIYSGKMVSLPTS